MQSESKMHMRIKQLGITAIIFLALLNLTNAQTFPTGFNQVLVAPGISAPTTMALAPDGRFFIAQQYGQLRVVKNDTLLSQPFISLNVNIDGERGLLGVAIDPLFLTNHYIYLCYTVSSGLFNRVSRFTASGDTVVPGSEVVILDLDTLIANYHGGGHLDFGPDGKLYIATGENGRPNYSQDLDSYLGKILRVNPDGSTPVDNPFPGPAKRQRVWAYGFRNPFTFSFQPGTGRMFINDVGEVTYEEINEATVGGGNYGWPGAEGNSTNPAYVNPVFTYLHGITLGTGCAITGGTFFNPDTTNYPAAYLNKYFFIDYCGNWIDMITLDSVPVWSNFGTGIANYSVGMLTGHDGNLYFLSRNNEALYKVTYSSTNTPIVVNQPISQVVSVGYPATMSVTASGAPTLAYQWYKDTTLIQGAIGSTYTIPVTAFSDSGYYHVTVTNSFGNTVSNDAYLTITSNQPPQAVIDTPATASFYTAGDVINYHGSASDPEDGTVPDSMLEWVVVFHHDTHVHPGPTAMSGVSSGTFTIGNVGEKSTNVFYRLYLIVHDSNGLVDSAFVDLYPRVSTLTITSQPTGLTINLDGQPFTTPHTVLSVEGMYRMIDAPVSQSYGLTPLVFTAWSNGGTNSQTFTIPVNDTIFTAIYDSIQLNYTLGNDTILCTGNTLNLDAGSNYSSYAWSNGSNTSTVALQSSSPDTIYIGVTVRDANGLTGNDSIMVVFENCTGIAEEKFNSVKVYPNPGVNDITIESQKVDYQVFVYDISGQVVINGTSVPAHETKKIKLAPGSYVLVLRSEDNQELGRKQIVIAR